MHTGISKGSCKSAHSSRPVASWTNKCLDATIMWLRCDLIGQICILRPAWRSVAACFLLTHGIWMMNVGLQQQQPLLSLRLCLFGAAGWTKGYHSFLLAVSVKLAASTTDAGRKASSWKNYHQLKETRFLNSKEWKTWNLIPPKSQASSGSSSHFSPYSDLKFPYNTRTPRS